MPEGDLDQGGSSGMVVIQIPEIATRISDGFHVRRIRGEESSMIPLVLV